MGKLNKSEINKRREEIIDICDKLYKNKGLDEININEISKELSFTRTAIYSYFNNKEEIFLALLTREYIKWGKDLEKILNMNKLDTETFSDLLAKSLNDRETLLKILSRDLSSLDSKSSMDILIDFKKEYGKSLSLIDKLLISHLSLDEEKRKNFLFIFFPFLFGVFPYTHVTKKQKEAMNLGNVSYIYYSQYEIIKNCIIQLLEKR